MEDQKRQPGYDAVIPARVRYDPELPDKAKLLYGEIRALATREGFCWATNSYFCELYNVSERTVRRLLAVLTDHQHIFTEVIRDEETQAVMERRIWVDRARFLSRDPDIPPMGIDDDPPDKNVRTPPDKNVRTPPDKNVRENIYKDMNNTRVNTPLKPPQGGRRAKRAPREAPDWKPDRFAGFWSFYPRGENKQRAMDAWDRLRPDDALIDRIAKALVRLKRSKDWQEGIGIPHASTWLNNARWEDADSLPQETQSSGGWADDPEVIP